MEELPRVRHCIFLLALRLIQQVLLDYGTLFFRLTSFLHNHVGNIYIADTSHNIIRKVTVSTGIITTIAGNGGTGSYSGDGGGATSAALSNPVAVALDSAGTLPTY